MQNIIEQVYDFNQQAGLLDKGYSDTLESAFQIEEALEGFNLEHLYNLLHEQDATYYEQIPSDESPKSISRAIVANTAGDLVDVDRLDKACDAIIFAIGSMAKLGLTPSQIDEALHVVATANLQKLGMPKDEHGKLIKPANFVGPEVLLQEILNER